MFCYYCIKSAKPFKKIWRVAFTLGCFFATSYMANSQIMRWLENQDASTIEFKRFNLSPDDKYPDISICFTGHNLNWYEDDSVFNTFGVTTAVYEQMLKGIEGFAYDYNSTSKLFRKIRVENKDWHLEDVERFQIKASTLVTGLEYITEDDSTSIAYGKHKYGKHVSRIPLQPSLKTPDTICFTRKSNDVPDSLRVYDLLRFNRSILGHGKYEDTEVQLFVHYPQQLVRSFHRPVYKSTFGDIRRTPKHGNKNPWKKLLRIAISKVTVLRKRPGSNVPCDDKLVNDDVEFQREIMERIKCIPIYWKYNSGSNLDLKICNTSEDLKKAYYNLNHYKTIFATYDPPCTSIEVGSRYDKEEETESEDPQIRFLYTESVYQEITNTEKFGFESFVSGLGGFVGIFLGYSILQLPELLSLIPSFIRKVAHLCGKGN